MVALRKVFDEGVEHDSRGGCAPAPPPSRTGLRLGKKTGTVWKGLNPNSEMKKGSL